MRLLPILLALALQQTPQALIQEIRDRLTALEAALPPAQGPPPSPPASTTITVSDAAGLTAALHAAPEGAKIALAEGRYAGPFTVAKPLTLMGYGEIVAPDGGVGLTITASDVTLTGITVTGNANDLIVAAGARFTADGITLTGTGSTKRGIKLDGASQVVRRSRITNIARVGQDSQCIAGWNTPGPVLIEDNYLECASENILFGGAAPSVPGTIPSDIVIRRNTLTKNLAWKGAGVNVKNLIEFKSARRVQVIDNTLEHSWVDGQAGFAIVLTPKVEGPVVEDVLFEGNTIRGVVSCVQLSRAGFTLQRVTFRRNRFESGTGRCVLLLGGMDTLVFEQNSIYQGGTSFLYQHSGAVTGFRFVGNLVRVSGKYGICTEGNCYGRLWQNALPGGVIEGNALVAFPFPGNLAGNLFLATTDPDPAGYGQ